MEQGYWTKWIKNGLIVAPRKMLRPEFAFWKRSDPFPEPPGPYAPCGAGSATAGTDQGHAQQVAAGSMNSANKAQVDSGCRHAR